MELTVTRTLVGIVVLCALAAGGQSAAIDSRWQRSPPPSELAALLEQLEQIAARDAPKAALTARPKFGAADRSATADSAATVRQVDVGKTAGAASTSASAAASPAAVDVETSSSWNEDDEEALLSRLEALDELLRRDAEQAAADAARGSALMLQSRGFDRHGRVFDQWTSDGSRENGGGGSRPENDAIGPIDSRGNAAAPSGTLALLARLLQGDTQERQTSERSGGKTSAAVAAQQYDSPSSAVAAPRAWSTDDSRPAVAAADREFPQLQRQQPPSSGDALLLLTAIVRDVAVEEESLHEENERMLDTVVAIAALEAKQRAASERRLLGEQHAAAAAAPPARA